MHKKYESFEEEEKDINKKDTMNKQKSAIIKESNNKKDRKVQLIDKKHSISFRNTSIRSSNELCKKYTEE